MFVLLNFCIKLQTILLVLSTSNDLKNVHSNKNKIPLLYVQNHILF